VTVAARSLLRRLLLGVALGVLVSLGLALTANLGALGEALGRFRWRLGPAILGAVLANYTLRFWKWEYYLRCLGVRLPTRQSLGVFLAGFTMAITPGKLGEVLKAFLVRDLTGTPVSVTTSVVMAERLTDVAALLGLAALGATALPHGPLLLGIGAALLALSLTALRSPWLADAAHRVLARGPLARLAGPFRLFLGTGRTLLDPARLTFAVALSVASWFFECLALYLVLDGLGVAVTLRAATFVYAFASLAGAVSMLPGGLGVAEGSLAGLLVALGLGLPDAAAATLLIRAATLWLAIGLGGATLGLAFRGRPRTSDDPVA
jgi:uncharacterized membrane protein YbhN (UPF0104 family)